MDGLLVIDKPTGPTSHDVVARARRLLREKRIGHTGTLDPLASGVLPLVVGRATRLARFMSDHEKRYDAVVRLGFATDSYDAQGEVQGPVSTGPWPPIADIERALERFRGTFLQQPPAFSAKKIDGTRSYALARHARRNDTGPTVAALPPPAEVTAFEITVTAVERDRVSVSLSCSSGFYVRSLAHDLGQLLGTGAHLEMLRRTATSGVTLADAVPLAQLEADPALGGGSLIPMGRMLTHLTSVTLTASGATRAAHGQLVGPADIIDGHVGHSTALPQRAAEGFVRLMSADGALLGIAEWTERAGLLHPIVILM